MQHNDHCTSTMAVEERRTMTSDPKGGAMLIRLLPDTRLARDAEELLRASSPVFLVNHGFRSYFWSVALAEHDGTRFDAELLFVAALLHDLGLVAAYDTGKCFEVDGAVAAEWFALGHGCPPQRAHVIKEAIRLHMIADAAALVGPEAVLLWDATGVDVIGSRYADVEPETVRAVLARYPREDFKHGFAALFGAQARAKPGCRVAEKVADGYLSRIADAPFDS
jgi:HD domain-containing protein